MPIYGLLFCQFLFVCYHFRSTIIKHSKHQKKSENPIEEACHLFTLFFSSLRLDSLYEMKCTIQILCCESNAATTKTHFFYHIKIRKFDKNLEHSRLVKERRFFFSFVLLSGGREKRPSLHHHSCVTCMVFSLSCS